MTGQTGNQQLTAVGRRLGSDPAARRVVLVRRLGRGVRPAVPGSWSPRARSRTLDQAKRPNSYWAHSDPGDVARVEDRTFICSDARARRRPEQQLAPARRDARRDARRSTRGAMQGRTMYVVPFSMGPLGSPIAHIGVQLTDSAYVAVSMRIMTRMGQARARRARRRRRVRALRALGRRPARRRRGRRAVAVQPRQQVHRPLPRDPRDLVLRLGLRRQRPARQEVLRPAHRLGDGPRRRLAGRAHADPQADQPAAGVEVHRRRVPVGVRQDEPGDARADDPRLEGRDGRRRHLLDEVRRRRPALRDQPRGRVLRRRARHRLRHQPQRDGDAVGQLHLHQHRAHRRRRRVVGGHDRRRRRPGPPTGRATPGPRRSRPRPPTRTPASRRRRRSARRSPPSGRTPPACRSRRSCSAAAARTTVPLVTEAYDWEHGVFLGSIMASETTAAQPGAVGKLRFDPMAMLPFCGYNFADYFAHWLSIGKSTDTANLPKIFFVNWFRRDDDGRFLWPGFGENSRVLKWVFERVNGDAEAVETPIGLLPTPDALDTDGLEIADDDLDDAAGGRHRRLARGGPADPRALRPVRLGPPGLADRGPRHPRRPPRLTRATSACVRRHRPFTGRFRRTAAQRPGPATTMNSLSSARLGLRPVFGKLLSQPSSSSRWVEHVHRLDRLARHPERVAEADVAGVDRRQRDEVRVGDRGEVDDARLDDEAVGADVAQVDLVDRADSAVRPRRRRARSHQAVRVERLGVGHEVRRRPSAPVARLVDPRERPVCGCRTRRSAASRRSSLGDVAPSRTTYEVAAVRASSPSPRSRGCCG